MLISRNQGIEKYPITKIYSSFLERVIASLNQ